MARQATFDALGEQARTQLEGFSRKAQALFAELHEDAGSELQQELLQRALAAQHSPAELHAFADALRGLSDAEVFAACTLDADAPSGYSVAQLLRAESDPLFAYQLKGGQLSPSQEASPAPPSAPPQGPPPASPWDSKPGRGRQELGASAEAVPRAAPKPISALSAAVPRPVAGALFEDLVNAAVYPLGLSFREHELDTGALTLEAALPRVAEALKRGWPVPAAIGPGAGKSARLVLLLQLSVSGARRAYQLLDPLSQELVWANEGDLLARTELPFSNKQHRRLTRLALPTRAP